MKKDSLQSQAKVLPETRVKTVLRPPMNQLNNNVRGISNPRGSSKPSKDSKGSSSSSSNSTQHTGSQQLIQVRDKMVSTNARKSNSFHETSDPEIMEAQKPVELTQLLKQWNLEQYTEDLSTRGYLSHQKLLLVSVSPESRDRFFSEINCTLAEHKIQFEAMIDSFAQETAGEDKTQKNIRGSKQMLSQPQQHQQSSLPRANIAQTKLASLRTTNANRLPPSRSGLTAVSTATDQLARKTAQPTANQESRNNAHMFYQGNVRQPKSQSSYQKKRRSREGELGYDYFIEDSSNKADPQLASNKGTISDGSKHREEFSEAIEGLVKHYKNADPETKQKAFLAKTMHIKPAADRLLSNEQNNNKATPSTASSSTRQSVPISSKDASQKSSSISTVRKPSLPKIPSTIPSRIAGTAKIATGGDNVVVAQSQQQSLYQQHSSSSSMHQKHGLTLPALGGGRQQQGNIPLKQEVPLKARSKAAEEEKSGKLTQQPVRRNPLPSFDQNKRIVANKGNPVKESRTAKVVQDDMCLVPEYDGNDRIVTTYKRNRLLVNLQKQNATKDNPDELDPQLDYENIKQMYISYDGGKLTSTLVNLDIEEMCYCLACAIIKHIERGGEEEKDQDHLHSIQEEKEEKQLHNHIIDEPSATLLDVQGHLNSTNDSSAMNNGTANQLEEPLAAVDQEDADDGENNDSQVEEEENKELPMHKNISRSSNAINAVYWKDPKYQLSEISERTHEVSHQQIRSQTINSSMEPIKGILENRAQSRGDAYNILKESIFPPNRPAGSAKGFNSNNVDFQPEMYGEVQSEGEVEEEEDREVSALKAVAEEVTCTAAAAMSFSMISRYSMVLANDQVSNKKLFDKTFNCAENSDAIYTVKPTRENVQSYCKNICISCQLEKQIPIIALVYVERLLTKSRFAVTAHNWRKVILTAMIMASKIWDDESFENQNFAQAFDQFDVVQINEMERVFLSFIEYNLYIKAADYAKYYFILREFAQKNKKSFPLRPLDLKTILFLQNNANRAQGNLREIYSNPLNKSF